METEAPTKVRVKFLAVFKELFNTFWRYIIFYGGRNSGKSRHVAEALLLRARARRLRILCTREIQNTIKDSVHKLLKDLIEQHGYTDYVVTDETIRNKVTGSEFIFKGLHRNSTEIKSTEGVDICWVEEAQSVTKESFDILVPTIRKPGSQIILTYNRLTELDAVHVDFVINRKKRTYVRKVNYDVLEAAGLLSDEIALEIEADMPFPSVFAHKWLGEPVGQVDGAIISRDDVLEAMRRTVEDDGAEEYGADIARLGGDRIVFFKRKGLQTKGYEVHQKMRIPAICDALERFVGFRKNYIDEKTKKPVKGPLIKIDDTGVGGGVTDEMMKRGYNAVGINFGGEPNDKDKYPNWISEAWFYVADLMPQMGLPQNDSDLLMELTNRLWRMDNKGKRRVESKDEYKKRGFNSPDLADACIICYAPPARPKSKGKIYL